MDRQSDPGRFSILPAVPNLNMRLRTVAAMERAVVTLREQVDQVCLAFQRGQLGEHKPAVMFALYFLAVVELRKESDHEAVEWFFALPTIGERASMLAAAICAVDLRLGREGRPCIWCEVVEGKSDPTGNDEGKVVDDE